MRTGCLLISALISCATFAQTPARLAFEVASIRPSAALVDAPINTGLHIDGAQVRVTNVSLKNLIAIAYRLKTNQITGPDWISSVRFDLSATIPSGAEAQVPEMLTALLVDRFQLQAHAAKKEFPAYALVIGNAPLKLIESAPQSDDDPADPKASANVSATAYGTGLNVNLGNGSTWSFVPSHFEGKRLTMAQFVGNLERFSDRFIVDLTDLKGVYDLRMDVSPDDYSPLMIRAAVNAGYNMPPQAMRALDNSSPSVLGDAVATIGLKLEKRKLPINILAVDDALRTPTEN
jgi:uncharacterized protein (TIGR03435 family)